MALSPLSLIILLLSLLAATSSARPCKTLFYFSSTTTTTFYPQFRNPNFPNSIFQLQNPRHFTLILTTTTEFHNRASLNFNSIPTVNSNSDSDSSSSSSSEMTSFDFPLKLYSSVSSSVRDRTKDIMSVVGALLFGVACGALTAATMYFFWALFSARSFDLDEVSSDDEETDDVAAAKRKLGYVEIPADPKTVDAVDELKKAVPVAKEVV